MAEVFNANLVSGVVQDTGSVATVSRLMQAVGEGLTPTNGTLLYRLKTLEGYLDGVESLLSTLTAGLSADFSGFAGKVSSGVATDVIYNGITPLTPKFKVITASATGDNVVVASVASKKIRVLAYNFAASSTVNVKFRSGTTDISGPKYCQVNDGMVAPFSPVGWFETAPSTDLNINLSGNVPIGGELVYVEV